MKYLLISALLTACNFGLVDVEDKTYKCYDLTYVFDRDTIYIDSTAKRCGETRVSTPFDHVLDPLIK